MSLPPAISDALNEFRAAIEPVVSLVALYVGGSLATGDYRAGVSDLDLAAVVAEPLNRRTRREVRRNHRRFIVRRPEMAKLHCVYVPVDEVADVARPHVTWAGTILFRRSFSGIARAEIQRHGITVFGPPPEALIPSVTDAELCAAVRRDLTGYWSRALRKPEIWLRDFYVDLGLLTLARAEATLTDGELITKRDALARLPRLGVPPDLVDQIRSRRDGTHVPISTIARLRRARLTRRLVATGITTLRST